MSKKDSLICSLCKTEINKVVYCLSDISYIVKKKVNNKYVNFINHPYICDDCYNKILKEE